MKQVNYVFEVCYIYSKHFNAEDDIEANLRF